MSDTAVVLEYIFGGCNCLDEYSNFLTPDRLTDLHGNINGEFVGLGIEMKAEPGKGMFLVNVLPESPAEQGGLHPGDYITQIDGTNCARHDDRRGGQAAPRTAGKPRLAGRPEPRARQPRTGQFVRRAVEVKSIPVAQIVDPQQGIGYIRMTGFQSTSPRELDAALAKLSRRRNAGPDLGPARKSGRTLAGRHQRARSVHRFGRPGLDARPVARTRTRRTRPRRTRNTTFRSCCLVDEDSASASEIVAGAVRDHKRGTIVGRQTYGKWCVQSIYHMPDGAGLRLTTAKFYSPFGHNLHESRSPAGRCGASRRRVARRRREPHGLQESAGPQERAERRRPARTSARSAPGRQEPPGRPQSSRRPTTRT